MNRGPIRLAGLSIAILMALPGIARAVQVDYIVDAGLEHDDNVRLTASDPISQNIWRAGLGFRVTEASSVVQANLDGRIEYRHFQSNAYSDTVDGWLAGRLNWVVMPERLSFSVEDNLEMQAIDRFNTDTPDNRQRINVLSLGPNLFFNLGRGLRGQLEARYINTRAEVTDEFNSDRVGLALRAIKDISPNDRLSFNAQAQDVDYDNDELSRDHTRNDLYVRYEHTFSNVELGLDAGRSRINFRQGSSRSSPLLRAELGWRASERSHLAAYAVDQFSDAASATIADTGIDSGSDITTPGGILIDGRTITSAIYREKRVGMLYAYDGARLSLQVEPYSQRLDYIDEFVPDENSHGIRAAFDYRLRPLLTLSADADVVRINYRDIDTSDDAYRLRLALEKQWTRHWSSSLSFARYQRDSGFFTSRIQQNIWYLSIAYRNR